MRVSPAECFPFSSSDTRFARSPFFNLPYRIFQKIPGIQSRIRNFCPFQNLFCFFSCFFVRHTFSCHPKFSFRYALQSNTASTDAIATSAMEASGSLVVSFCSIIPGFDKKITSLFSLFPARRINSNETPGDHRDQQKPEYHSPDRGFNPDEQKENNADDHNDKQKLVPQRLCSLELFSTFSTFNSMPCSIQLIHLCSAPWYINTR